MSTQLEERFLNFAICMRDFCRLIKMDTINVEYVRQLIRSSSSIGANYLEASDDLGRQDERMKIKISRRESKESIFWLQLISTADGNQEFIRKHLIDEGTQINKILSAILLKLEK